MNWPPSASTATVLGRQAMRALDEQTISAGVPSLELMERAGDAITAVIEELEGLGGGPRLEAHVGQRGVILVLAGSGNNGGDGFVVARRLAEMEWEPIVVLCSGPPKLGGDADENLRRWRDGGGAVLPVSELDSALNAPGPVPPLVLDCILGTGLDRPVKPELAKVISAVNAADLATVSVDIPSGLSADTGEVLGASIRADVTVTIGAGKPGLFVADGPDHAGRVVVADIGLREPGPLGLAQAGILLDRFTVAPLVAPRATNAHKGSQGHVLVLAGSVGKAGAALLAGQGALRAGAGLVTVAVPQPLAESIDVALAETMTLGLPAQDGALAATAYAALEETLDAYDAVVVGPGLGTGAGSSVLVPELLRNFKGPMVVDADGLNVLAAELSALGELLDRRAASGAPAPILTPHPGEMARLVASDAASVQGARLHCVRGFCRERQAVLVLKGAATLIGQGQRLAFNTSGNSGMAAPGMGDVLAGCLGGLLASRVRESSGPTDSAAVQTGGDGFSTACLGVFAHGLAGDLVAAELGGPGFAASEVAKGLPVSLAELGIERYRGVT